MDTRSLEIIDLIDNALESPKWTLVDYEFRLEDEAGVDGMMIASVSLNDGTVQVVEFEGWGIVGQYVFSGSPDVVGARAAALLNALAAVRA